MYSNQQNLQELDLNLEETGARIVPCIAKSIEDVCRRIVVLSHDGVLLIYNNIYVARFSQTLD